MKRLAKTTAAAALLASLMLVAAGPAGAQAAPAPPPATVTGTGAAGAVADASCAAGTAVGSGSDVTAGTGFSSQKSIQERFTRFTNCTELGKVVVELAIWVGIGIILIVGSKALFTAAKTGAGIMTAVPTVLVAVLVGGLLINIDLTVGMFSWVVQAAQKAVSSGVALLPGS